MNLSLNYCTAEAARYACEHWHYAKVFPFGKSVKVGVWEDQQFIGAIVFGTGANLNLARPFGLTAMEACELVRVALRAHQAPVTRMVAIALRMLHRQCPGIRLVISYADTSRGHHGGIYQGGNWIYTGSSRSDSVYIIDGGQPSHRRGLHAVRQKHKLGHLLPEASTIDWARQVLKLEIQQIRDVIKHRYVYPLDQQLQPRLQTMARPYPKRGRSAENGTVAHQPQGTV